MEDNLFYIIVVFDPDKQKATVIGDLFGGAMTFQTFDEAQRYIADTATDLLDGPFKIVGLGRK